MRVAVLLFVLGAACGGEASDRCRNACDRADECAENVNDPNFKFDKGECTAACSFLEKDKDGEKLVASYVECLKTAKTCEQVNTCE